MEENIIKNTVIEIFTKLEEKYNGKTKEKEIQTGFIDIDYITEGLHKSSLIVIASRPAMGKTTLGLNIATNVANQNIPVAIFSLEMSKEQYIKKIICSQAMIDSRKFNSLNEIRAKSIKLKQEKDIGLIVIDYLQLIQCSENFNTYDQKIAEVSKSLKELSQEINVTIIVISQLSREPDKRFYLGEDARPKLSDLNRAVVQDADIIMFLYRDDYYNTDSQKKDIAEIIIAKNKYGNRTAVELLFLGKYFKFVNLEKCFDGDIQIEE